MSVTSCQQKIELIHPYYNILPIIVESSSAQTIEEAIIYTFFVKKNHYGLTQIEITLYVAEYFPQYDVQQIAETFAILLKNGVLVTLQAICVDWCANQCPIKKFAISRNIDKLPTYSTLVLYLIQLSGGTRVTSRTFNDWFLSNRNLQGSLVTNIKRSAFSAVCV